MVLAHTESLSGSGSVTQLLRLLSTCTAPRLAFPRIAGLLGMPPNRSKIRRGEALEVKRGLRESFARLETAQSPLSRCADPKSKRLPECLRCLLLFGLQLDQAARYF